MVAPFIVTVLIRNVPYLSLGASMTEGGALLTRIFVLEEAIVACSDTSESIDILLSLPYPFFLQLT